MLIDSGATSNIMGENAWEKLKAEKIKCHSHMHTPQHCHSRLKVHSDVKSR